MSKRPRFETFTNIDFVVKIPVTFEEGALFSNLVGATVDARAVFSSGAVIVGEASVDQEDDKTIIVLFRRGTLPPGVCECQVWALLGQQAAMPFVFEADVKQGLRPVEA